MEKQEQEQAETGLRAKWHDKGVAAGKTDGWMCVESTLAETLGRLKRRHPEWLILHDELVWVDIGEWETTDHFYILYGSNIMDDTIGDGDLYPDFKCEFWRGYLEGRKQVGIDIYELASKLTSKAVAAVLAATQD